jgi:hypothetical protein
MTYHLGNTISISVQGTRWYLIAQGPCGTNSGKLALREFKRRNPALCPILSSKQIHHFSIIWDTLQPWQIYINIMTGTLYMLRFRYYYMLSPVKTPEPGLLLCNYHKEPTRLYYKKSND